MLKKFNYLILAVILIALAWISEKNLLQNKYNQFDVEEFQQTIHKKENGIQKLMEDIAVNLKTTSYKKYFDENSSFFENLHKNKGYILLFYKNDSLKFWSDNLIDISNKFSRSKFASNFIHLKNGWFVCKTQKNGNQILVGLILVKYDYALENKFLKNTFQEDFRLNPSAEINYHQTKHNFKIEDLSKHYLFSLNFSNATKIKLLQFYLPIFLYLSGLIFLLISFIQLIKRISKPKIKKWAILLLAFLLFGLKFIMVQYQWPDVIYSLELFSPKYFAISNFLPSLGDLLLSSIFAFYIVFIFYREFHFYVHLLTKYKLRAYAIRYILLLSSVVGFFLTHYLFHSLILNSNITFEASKILDLSIYSFVGLLVVALNFTSFALLVDKTTIFYKTFFNLTTLIIEYVVAISVFYVFGRITGYKLDIFSILFLIFIIGFIAFIRSKKKYIYQYSTFALIAFLFSFYTVIFITQTTKVKERNNKKILAVNLATQHDPVAELLLDDLGDKIKNDAHLTKLLTDSVFNYDNTYNYLQRMYFSGFWEKYTLQVTICNPNDSVYLNPPDNIWKPCYSFFNDLLNRHGVKLVNSPFYYLDNLNGQISYFGWFGYSSVKKPFEITLFIELDTKLIAEQLGYPELLLDSKMSKPSALNEYSYAKYYNNGLIMQSGTFPYSLTTSPYPKSKSEYTFVTFDNYDHLIYKIDKKNTIVLSKASFRFFDALVSFTYIFVFFFTLITLVILFTNFQLLKQSFKPNFKNKIQLTMISVLSLSLLFVGGGTIYFSVQQYKNKVQELIHEKIQSVNSELLPNIGGENKLTADWYSNQYDNLNELLSKLSNVFYTDINLYDTQGNLLATSRPEIFEKGLIGTKINAAAYQQLIEKKKAEFVHNENIGKLQYLSAYVPFMNKGNKVLGYLNLPYFTQQDALSREISSLIVTIANIYVLLLLLSTSLAVFVSNKITFPLRIIQNKLGQVDLAKKNEPIVYNQKDEIGSLVKEYNHMLEELRNSAEILAKSERESAWREMAKQVAHEINNPLTPMKLSVQHLQRAWKDGIPNWDEQLQRFSKTLIEQIDTLSSIATEFSNFAKMPQSNYETFDLIPKIKTCVSLFENTENVIFEVNTHENKNAMIYADQEQISRVFNNLIKNAIQAFPANFKGTIKIDLSKKQEKVIVKVHDNGKGIPKEVGEKMFQPNFTTKSSGMGLGLAIVKNTIENVQGKIDYETQQGIGTTFIIELPLIAL